MCQYVVMVCEEYMFIVLSLRFYVYILLMCAHPYRSDVRTTGDVFLH